MEIEQVGLSPADTGRIRACFEVMLAAERVDHPEEPPFTEQPFTGWMTVGWDGSPREVWLATDQGQAVGWCRLDLPARENLDQAVWRSWYTQRHGSGESGAPCCGTRLGATKGAVTGRAACAPRLR